ncbi:MAG: lysophospholipid acyltransferase family protein [Patescibacteria group bacterium]
MKPYFIPPLILQKIIWVPTRFLLRFFGRLHIHGLENLRNIKGPIIFASNHSSETDVFLMPASLPFFSRFSPIFYVSREKSFYKNSGWRQMFYGGTFFKAWGAYPVYVGLHDYAKSLANHIEIINDGGSVNIFPEGKRTTDGAIKTARGGAAYLSYATRAAIVPVRFEGNFNLTLKEFFTRRRHFAIFFGKPLYAMNDPNTSLSDNDFKMFANFVMERVKKLCISA